MNEPVPEFDPANMAEWYIDRQIAIQVELGYDAPTAEVRASAIAAVERELWKLRK